MRIASIGNVATAAGIVGACLYFYNRIYNAMYLAQFGLGVGVVPMSAQDAMVDGLLGAAFHLLWLTCCLAVGLLLYYTAMLAIGHVVRRRLPPSLLGHKPSGLGARLLETVREDRLFRWLAVGSILVVMLSLLVTLGILLIGLPAEMAARTDARELKDAVTRACPKICATYRVDRGQVRGRIVGSTADRLFVWTSEGMMAPIRIDDIRAILPPPDHR